MHDKRSHISEHLVVTTDEIVSILHPKVHFCFTAEFVNVWNRAHTVSANSDAKERLHKLIIFFSKGTLKFIKKKSYNDIAKHLSYPINNFFKARLNKILPFFLN